MSNQPYAQSAVQVQSKISKLHIQLKPSKQRNQRCKKNKNINNTHTQKTSKQTNKSHGWAGKGARYKYQVSN